MKRITLLLMALLSLPFFSYSGGIVHNTNQSAAWVRMFARDASTSIDAVFYNPAGLTKLGDGFYISLNSQTLFQNRTITSSYSYLNNDPVDYEGSVTVPILPSIYASYNTGKFAFSFGVNVIGGGGTAEFGKGLPSFEMGIADLVPALNAMMPTSAYSLDAYLEGSSVFWGYQLGASYKVNDIFSVYLGGRYVTAKNTYIGHLKDIMINPTHPLINPTGEMISASDFFTNIGDANTAAILADQTADIEQTGSGITPIIGVNISPNDKLNFGLKYELQTNIELKNNTTKDFIIDYDYLTDTETGMFPDGEKFRNDMPALLTVGVDYQMSDKFLVSTGMHYYFDKNADYGYKDANDNAIKNSDVFDSNYWEWALGLQYNISDKILVSAGYLRAQSGLKAEYQTDLNYKISSNSFGLGGAYSITPKIDLNLAVAYTTYVEDSKDYQHDLAGSGTLIDVTETYNRDNLFFGLGLDFKFGGKKSE